MFGSGIGARSVRRRLGKFIAGGLAALMIGTALIATGGGLVPAIAAEGASLQLVKQVKKLDGSFSDEARDLRPGDSVSYRVEFRVNDEDADAPALVADVLPPEFAGWEISQLTAVVGGSTANVTLDLPGVTTGASPSAPVAGIVGTTEADRTITVGIEQPVQAGAGNASGLGMTTRDTGVLEYTLTIPADLSPTDPRLRKDLVNTATFTAKAGAQDLRVSDTALITVDNPIRVDITPSKTWTPQSQNFQPGATSTITIGATQASNVDASSLSLSDPADAALAPDGATELPSGNPFNFVDFAGFIAPTDPTTNLPTGATSASVEVYRMSGGTWNWVTWSSAIPNEDIAGVRTSYEGTIPAGTEVAQGFTVTQRSTDRTSGDSISSGYDISNAVLATVDVPGEASVSKEAEAPFEVAPEQVGVTALKHFYALPDGSETTDLTGVTAGESVGVVLRAINGEAPASTVLDSLTIAEPASGSDARFFGEDLIFAGFDNGDTDAIWPVDANTATVTWTYSDESSDTDTVSAPSALPGPATGKTVSGFEITFTGAIAPGAASEVRYLLDSNSDETFVAPGAVTQKLRNTIEVTGSKTGLADDVDTASATVAYVAPKIEVSIDKRVGPGIVMPGQDVVVQLDTEVSTSGGRTKPTEIVVDDVLGEAGTFWDAFDAKQILPPITRPTNSGTPITTATLTIRYQDSAGDWQVLATDPDEDEAIDIPAGATGLRFTYTNTDGFSQTTFVKPNISFTARDTLRSDDDVATGTDEFSSVKRYENLATAESTGKLDDRVVTGDDTDKVDVGVRGQANSGPGTGGVWADKDWAHTQLTSQSHATTWTTQSWAVTELGFDAVTLDDPATPTASGAGTVFEAFDLTHIRPILYSGSASNSTIDPQLRWDTVTAVELWNGVDWEPVTAPDGSWMDANGFKGYTLTEAEQETTLGARLVLAENTAAREAARGDDDDLTVPAAGSGVAASADIRTYRLDWQLRETARTADGSLKWVKETDTPFNCEDGATGCIDNLFKVTGYPSSGSEVSDTANDTIQLLDGAMNVALTKQVQAMPEGTAGDSVRLVAPNAGELEQGDYPTARYTLTARNSSTAPADSRGAMRLAKIRVTDTSTNLQAQTPDIALSPFANRDFANEVASPGGNHFDEFTLTGVSFSAIPEYIDRDESTVELWLYDGADPEGTTAVYTLGEAIEQDAAFVAALENAIGIAVTFSGENPEENGNSIPAGVDLTTYLDVQLRATERLSGDPVRGGGIGSVVNLPNEAYARGWDAVIAPDDQPTSRDTANVELTQAQINVLLEKTISVDHDGTQNQTVYETDPQAPVNVLLTATPAGSTAPLNTLNIEDATVSFWNRFEFVSFGTAQLPRDADRATYEVLVNDAWVGFADYTDDTADIRGVRVVFDRMDEQLFPLGATSWSASWTSATLPVTVQLRDGVAVDWNADSEVNLATVTANNETYGDATWTDGKTVDFSPGVHQLRVEKRAPNDTSTHQVDALTSMPWKLVFTNTGSSYLPITSVTDALPENLEWDGEEPVVVSTPGVSGLSGIDSSPTVTLSDDGRDLVFEWPAGSRMEPGERVEITLGLMMQPMAASSRALNEVIVETGVNLETCEQPTDFGQAPNTPATATQCSNTNYVQPRVGTVIGVRKTVSGEPVDTLGENLVNGALDTRTLEECSDGNYFPIGTDYTRNPCASYTAVGATDTWKLENINSGTNPLARMVVVDMLPATGDKMLSGGAPRGSTFAPVLAGTDIRLSGLPAGATYTIEVTENTSACVGPDAGASLWIADPTCENQTTNPANVWTPLASYTGDIANIAGLRFDIDMSAAPLQPGGNVIIEFETINVIGDGSNENLQATLAQFEERQFAWNQNGAIAWDEYGTRVNLPASPQRAGVTVKTGSLVISKEVTGLGADRAPDSFDVELSCTVPSGLADPERVPLDLGADALVTVPKNGSVTLEGFPLGTNCVAQERGPVGSYLETARLIDITPNVEPASDGLSADLKIRESVEGEPTELRLMNGYAPIPPAPTNPENPDGLSLTGAAGGGLFAAAAAIILALGVALAAAGTVRARRRDRDTLTT